MKNFGHFTRLFSEEALELCVKAQMWRQNNLERRCREGAVRLMKNYNRAIERSNRWRRLLLLKPRPFMTPGESLERLKSASPKFDSSDRWEDLSWSLHYSGSSWWDRVAELKACCRFETEHLIDGELLEFMVKRSGVPPTIDPLPSSEGPQP